MVQLLKIHSVIVDENGAFVDVFKSGSRQGLLKPDKEWWKSEEGNLKVWSMNLIFYIEDNDTWITNSSWNMEKKNSLILSEKSHQNESR